MMELDFEALLELLSDGWSRHSAFKMCNTDASGPLYVTQHLWSKVYIRLT